MDYGSLLSSFNLNNGTNSNSIVWIVVILIILLYGKSGFGFGVNPQITTGAGGCCCSKHHHHSNCCTGVPTGINPAFPGGYGGSELFFIILILALVFLLNKDNDTEVKC